MYPSPVLLRQQLPANDPSRVLTHSIIERVALLLQRARQAGEYHSQPSPQPINSPLRVLLAAAAAAFLGYTLALQQQTST